MEFYCIHKLKRREVELRQREMFVSWSTDVRSQYIFSARKYYEKGDYLKIVHSPTYELNETRYERKTIFIFHLNFNKDNFYTVAISSM